MGGGGPGKVRKTATCNFSFLLPHSATSTSEYALVLLHVPHTCRGSCSDLKVRAEERGTGEDGGGPQEPLLEMGTKTAMSGGHEDEATSDCRETLLHTARSPSGQVPVTRKHNPTAWFFSFSFFKSYIIVLTNNNGPVTAPTILKGSKIRFGICNYEC